LIKHLNFVTDLIDLVAAVPVSESIPISSAVLSLCVDNLWYQLIVDKTEIVLVVNPCVLGVDFEFICFCSCVSAGSTLCIVCVDRLVDIKRLTLR